MNTTITAERRVGTTPGGRGAVTAGPDRSWREAAGLGVRWRGAGVGAGCSCVERGLRRSAVACWLPTIQPAKRPRIRAPITRPAYASATDSAHVRTTPLSR